MDWLTVINGLFGVGGLAVVLLKLIEIYVSRSKEKAETGVLKSEASENITEAAQVAANVLLQALNFKQLENKEYQERVKALEDNQRESRALIGELQAHRDERTKQIEELTENNEALLSQVAALRAQIAKDTAETREIRQKHEDYKKALILIFESNPNLNLPAELATLLGDSINGLKWRKS